MSSTRPLPFDNDVLNDATSEKRKELSLKDSLDKAADRKQSNTFRVDKALDLIWKSDARVMRRASELLLQRNHGGYKEKEFEVNDVFAAHLNDGEDIDIYMNEYIEGDVEMQATITMKSPMRESNNPLMKKDSPTGHTVEGQKPGIAVEIEEPDDLNITSTSI